MEPQTQWIPPAPPAPLTEPTEPARPPYEERRKTLRERILGPIVVVGALLAKFGKVALLFATKAKFLATSGSMLVSVAAYALIWGWTFAVGFVALLFVHEMGHYIQLRREGVKPSGMLFIPFLGAVVGTRSLGGSALAEARVGLAGPVLGTLGALVTAGIYLATGNEFWKALAFTGFFLNLFNLIPMLPLDGGRAAAALHPVMWLLGLVGLVALMLYHPNFVILLILILGGTEAWRRFRGRNTAESRAYYTLTRQQRQIMTVAYFGLIAVLVLAMHATYTHRTFPA